MGGEEKRIIFWIRTKTNRRPTAMQGCDLSKRITCEWNRIPSVSNIIELIVGI